MLVGSLCYSPTSLPLSLDYIMDAGRPEGGVEATGKPGHGYASHLMRGNPRRTVCCRTRSHWQSAPRAGEIKAVRAEKAITPWRIHAPMRAQPSNAPGAIAGSTAPT